MTNHLKMVNIYVCSAIIAEDLISVQISANSEKEAAEIFYNENSFLPKKILGPFYKKKVKRNLEIKNIKFSNEIKKAMYNNELVNAFLLTEPKNMAYLIFINSENKSVLVNINELRYL